MIKDEAGQTLLVNIGEGFKILRQEAGLTQREAAKKAESTQARISDLENGKKDVLVLSLLRWAQVYGYEIEVHLVPVEDEAQADFEAGLADILAEVEKEQHAEVH